MNRLTSPFCWKLAVGSSAGSFQHLTAGWNWNPSEKLCSLAPKSSSL